MHLLASVGKNASTDYIQSFFLIIIIIGPLIVGGVLVWLAILHYAHRPDKAGQAPSVPKRRQKTILLLTAAVVLLFLFEYFFGHTAVIPWEYHKKRPTNTQQLDLCEISTPC